MTNIHSSLSSSFLLSSVILTAALLSSSVTCASAFVIPFSVSSNVNLKKRTVNVGTLTTLASEPTSIQGCSITEEGNNKYSFAIDGEQADLGRFSEAIYKKICMDAKSQRFQGFRPGTIPPHLLPTYYMFSMDECARETTLEAMEQNNIKPFESARNEFEFEQISIPPILKKKKGGRKKKRVNSVEDNVVTPEWRTFDSMKGACDAGWKPGQPFRFVVKNCAGQKMKDGTNVLDPMSINDVDSEAVSKVLQNQKANVDFD